MAKTMTSPPSNHERDTKPSSNRKKKKQKRSKDPLDDTPKAFTRLMAYAASGKLPNGLDDPKSTSTSKKRKRSHPTGDSAPTPQSPTSSGPPPTAATQPRSKDTDTVTEHGPLTLLPGEKLSDFSRRVDAAIPVSFKGLQRGEDDPKNRKKKKKKQEEPTEEDITEDAYDFDDNGDPLPNHLKPHDHNPHHRPAHKDKNKNRQRSPSPFSALRKQRGAVQSNINDVVQAPPSLVVPKEKLRDKTRPAAAAALGVPKSSGSLARREMLEVERQGIVERYRALMAAKSGGA